MKCCMSFVVSVLLLATIAIAQSGHSCRGDALTKATVDLRGYGWEPPDRKQVVSRFIAVDQKGRVVISYATRVRTKLVTRDRPSVDLRILRFSEDGKLDLSLSLPTHLEYWNSIYLSDSGQIIAKANDSLQLYQEDIRAWKVLAKCTSQCSVQQSVTRRTLAIRNEYHGPLLFVHLSPVPRLQQCDKAYKSAEGVIEDHSDAITDEFAYHSGSEGLEQFTYRWPFCDYEHRVELPLRPGGYWGVLNDHFCVFYPYDPHEDEQTVKVVSSDGRVIFQSVNRKHEYALGIGNSTRSSEQGSRIAVNIVTLRGGNRVLDISSHATARRIAVYDIGLRKEVASIPASWKSHEFGFDLSPDGGRLAIVEDGILRVIDLDGKHTGGGMGSRLPAEGRK
jgi:WD40 repeat protein